MAFVYEPKAPWIENSHLQRFIAQSGCKSFEDLLQRSQTDTEWFWSLALRDMNLRFSKPYSKILTNGLPWPKWVEGAELSVVENCIDRHLEKNANSPALIFEADEPGHSHIWSFTDLARESSFIAAELQSAGAKPGDRAALLMPMSLEMVASFFGILRAGLTVVPIFSGYGPDAVAARLQDGEIKFVFIQERTTRKSKEIHVSASLDEALKTSPTVQKIFKLNRSEFHRGHQSQKIIPPVSMPAESECLLLYTSGTTGKPKACVHTPFGILATTGKEHRYSFDVHGPTDSTAGDRFFWYTDIGWMMGPWELIGSLQFGATVVLFEGVPDFPTADRLWEIIRDHQVTHLGISPTAIRVLKKSETGFLDRAELKSLRILGSTGEPWDEESWNWFFKKVGRERCPIMNISGGTEIMGCLLMPTPFSKLKPATLGGPALGVFG
jgi:acetyl-CoA synthetase